MAEVVMSEFWSTDLEEQSLADIEIASQVVSSPTTIDVDVPNLSNVFVQAPVKKIKTQPLKTVAKKSKTTSDIWDHFAKIEGSDPCRAKCNYCEATYAADSKLNGTTNMWVHIDTRCKKYPFRIEKKQKTMHEFSVVEDDGTCSLVGSKPKALDIQAIREALSKMAESMRAKFNKYWVDASCMNNLVFLGVVFDPKYKFKHVQFCFRKIYEDKPEIGKLLISNMKLELEALFKQYMERHTTTEKAGNFVDSTSSSKSIETNDAWKILESQFQMELEKDASVEKKCELTQYLNEPCEKDVNLDILQWWKVNASRFPILSKLAKDVLAIPVSTVASEQAFSTGGRVLNEFRSSLNPKTVQMLICGQNWFRKNGEPIDINAMLEDVEKYEEIANEIDGSAG